MARRPKGKGDSTAVMARRHRKRAARGDVVWTEAAVAELERLYLHADTPPALIARALGFPVLSVRRKIKLTGLAGRRRAMGKGRLRARNLADIPGLVVTRLPAGTAAGVTGWETRLRTAPPPMADDKAVQRRRAWTNSRRARELAMTAGDVRTLPAGGA